MQSMKKIFLLSVFILFIACGVRQTQESLASGNYDDAIANAVDHLKNRKEAKGKQDYVYILEEAFAKAKARDLQNINTWFKDANPSNTEKIYNTYLQLHNRQELIKPLLPLKLLKEGRNAIFPMEDYSDQIISSKNALAKHLYDNSKALLVTRDKLNFRRAYDDLVYLNSLNPNYKDVLNLINDAKFKGTDFVYVNTKNETNMVIPTRLQSDLLDFSTYGLNDKWTEYHSSKQKNIDYDYAMVVNFRNINISPEQIREKEITKEKQIKVGTKTLLDSHGNPVKDEHGNPVKVDDFKTVRATIYETSQFKSVQVVAKVDYNNLKNNQLIESFPIDSEYIFEHIYSKYVGDKNACDTDYFQYFDNRSVPFPSNEQMIYDSGEDLKNKLKDIITRYKFRR
jgi:hypothetical protein